MWAQYRKRFIFMQVFILALCAVGYYGIHMRWEMILSFFVAMQVGAVAGAWYGARLIDKMAQRGDALPIRPVDRR